MRQHGFLREAEAGFSLIEVLVIIGIIGIIVAIAWPQLAPLAQIYRLEGAARSLAADIQRARGRAIAEGRCFEVVFSNAVKTYQINSKAGSSSCGTTGYSVDAAEPTAKSVDDSGSIGIENAASPGSDPVTAVFTPRGGVEAVSGAYPTIRVFNNLDGGRLVVVNAAGRVVVQ